MKSCIYFGDNLPFLRGLEGGSVDLIYIDPPFNTGKRQERTELATARSEDGGDRMGFGVGGMRLRRGLLLGMGIRLMII